MLVCTLIVSRLEARPSSLIINLLPSPNSDCAQVRNSQFVGEHVRGKHLTTRNRDAMELMVDICITYDNPNIAAWFSVDGMSRTPLIVDATSHLIGSCKGTTLEGDDRNAYDHSVVLGSRLLMDNTGVAICRMTDEKGEVIDQHGRPHLRRPKALDLCCFLRAVPDLEKGCTQYQHWLDIEETYLSILEEHRPHYLFLCSDNGSGYDPTDEVRYQ